MYPCKIYKKINLKHKYSYDRRHKIYHNNLPPTTAAPSPPSPLLPQNMDIRVPFHNLMQLFEGDPEPAANFVVVVLSAAEGVDGRAVPAWGVLGVVWGY